MSSDFIIELWDSLRPLVSKGDRGQAADNLIRISEEYGLTDGIEELAELDRDLRRAVQNHFGDLDDEDPDDYGGEW